jgi:hypothetical protein
MVALQKVSRIDDAASLTALEKRRLVDQPFTNLSSVNSNLTIQGANKGMVFSEDN